MFCLLSIVHLSRQVSFHCVRVVALALVKSGKVKLPETEQIYPFSEPRGNQAAVPETANKNRHQYSFFTASPMLKTAPFYPKQFYESSKLFWGWTMSSDLHNYAVLKIHLVFSKELTFLLICCIVKGSFKSDGNSKSMEITKGSVKEINVKKHSFGVFLTSSSGDAI